MTGELHFWDAVARIREQDERYTPEAYAFVMDSLEFGIRRIGDRRHVSGKELLEHACACAKEQFGVLAYTVLEKWGLRSTGDVGAVVFRLVDVGVLSALESDSESDFDDVFDLKERLEQNYFEVD
jgi:uncharacterized repeat protein (TIGR04138 family)